MGIKLTERPHVGKWNPLPHGHSWFRATRHAASCGAQPGHVDCSSWGKWVQQ